MLQKGKAKKLTVYVTESDTRHGKPVFQVIVDLAHKRGVAGATVVRGFMGFGASGTVHVQHPDLASKMPVRVEIVDSAEAIDKLLPDVYDIVEDGLVEVTDVEIVKVKARSAPPPLPPPAHATLTGKAQMLRIFVEATDQWEGRPLYEAIVDRLRQLDIAGATVVRGELGVGSGGEVHRHKALRHDEPVEVIVVDTAEQIARVGPALDEMVKSGMVVRSEVDVVYYRPMSQG